MKTIKNFLFVIAGILIFAACQKEYSVENGNPGGLIKGSIVKDANDNCLPMTINGDYLTDSTLSDSNYVLVQINVSEPGIYRVFTEELNGFSFRDSGYIGTTGLHTVKLRGRGRPVLAVPTDFTVVFDTSYCLFTVNVMQGTGGGGTPANFSLVGSPGNCSQATVQGTYQTGTPLNPATNTVVVDVMVTTAGNYTVNTGAQNGMTFSTSGSFVTTGPQTITLRGSGTPVTAGTTTVAITAGTSTCSFPVTVIQGSTTNPSGDYFPTTANSNWTYSESITSDTARVTATSTTANFSNNTYTVFTSAPFGVQSYYRKAAGFYYEYGNFNEVGIYDTVYKQTEFIFLKDNVVANTTWESPEMDAEFGGQTGKAKIKFTVTGKDITHTVGTNTFNNVIKIKRDYMFRPAGIPYITIVSVDFSYAKGIGFVSAEAPLFGVSLQATRWDVK